MSEFRLFTTANGKVQECHAAYFKLEKEIQHLFEANLETFLGVRFVASEFPTGQGGRIDTLGIDENGFPVIIEYKLDKNCTVINQGMSYMAWLRSHKMDFWKAVYDKYGQNTADIIDHTSTRLICIATDFTRDDLGAYELMPNNIDLVRYRRYGQNELLLERITLPNATTMSPIGATVTKSVPDKVFSQWLEEAAPDIKSLYESLRKIIMDLGEDVSEKPTKLYIAFKRTRNFASVTANNSEFILYLHLDPDTINDKAGIRDVRKIGHWGTGDVEVRIKTPEDISKALPLIRRAYEGRL